MKNYLIIIGCVLATQIAHADSDHDILERIEHQLKTEKDNRFYDAMRRGDSQGMFDNM